MRKFRMKQRFKCYFAHSIPKVLGTINDDSYSLSKDELSSLAVSDGATMAFNSSIWSKILVRNFVKYPDIRLDELIYKAKRVFDRYHRLFYFNNKVIPWNVLDVYEKGSFASLLGIRFLDDLALDITIVGDSIMVIIDPDGMMSIPFNSVSQFPYNPILLSSNLPSNYFLLEEEFLKNSTKTIKIKHPDDTLIYCMTDALAIWFLSDPERAKSKFSELLNKDNTEEQRIFFEDFVLTERETKRIKLDDTTLLIVGIE